MSAGERASDDAVAPVTLAIPVAWGDMDVLRHVNNVVYARWLESARIEYFARAGMLDLAGQGPILARQAIDFRSPVTFPDVVEVDVRVARLGTTSIDLRYRVRSRAQGGAIVAGGESIIVWYDLATKAKVALPDELRAAIAELEGHAIG